MRIVLAAALVAGLALAGCSQETQKDAAAAASDAATDAASNTQQVLGKASTALGNAASRIHTGDNDAATTSSTSSSDGATTTTTTTTTKSD
ncbi:MAG TPA: hypothetical protein VLM18_13035 [Croceibacterium sp.]|nr:hypothetical protein [Croceibacterium sp.]